MVAIRYKDPNDGLNHSDLLDEVISHCELSGTPYLLLGGGVQTYRRQEPSIPRQPVYGIGDISFYGNEKGLLDDFEGWCTNSYPYNMSPLSFEDVFAQDFVVWLRPVAERQVAPLHGCHKLRSHQSKNSMMVPSIRLSRHIRLCTDEPI